MHSKIEKYQGFIVEFKLDLLYIIEVLERGKESLDYGETHRRAGKILTKDMFSKIEVIE